MRIFTLGIVFLFCTQLYAQKPTYQSTLLQLCDALLPTQIADPADANFGALVCQSINPEFHPIHSRAGEAVYPFAVAYRITGNPKYRKAAINLGNWLVRIQETKGKRSGGWSEVWPDPEQKGWFGTTTDQLISLTGALQILKSDLSNDEKDRWNHAISCASDFIVAQFPMGKNINYNPTAAATLVLASQVSNNPQKAWLEKADSLMNFYTLNCVDQSNFLVGEGNGVDEGYNLAQSIGYIALYGILKKDDRVRDLAARMLKTHLMFVYPNGSVDNSWGTRSFKWSYESGTKTAPGVYFSFSLLADKDPMFHSAEMKCLEFLTQKCMNDGWIKYGPHAINHESSCIPCNYSTFARAQSIALALEYGFQTSISKPYPGQQTGWSVFFPKIKVAVVRTKSVMATVSAYGEISNYPRSSVCRGGSITNLWMDGFGQNGFMEASSNGDYSRIEAQHMPIENKLRPLTPRIEFGKEDSLFSNIFDAQSVMKVDKQSNVVHVESVGVFTNKQGKNTESKYLVGHRFFDQYLIKDIVVSGKPQSFRIVEPIVRDKDMTFELINDSTVIIKSKFRSREYKFQVLKSTVDYKIEIGNDSIRYWSPFPAVDAYPIVINFTTHSVAPQKVEFYLGKK